MNFDKKWRSIKRRSKRLREHTIMFAALIVALTFVPVAGILLSVGLCMLGIIQNARCGYDAYMLENEISDSESFSDEDIHEKYVFDYIPLVINIGICIVAIVIGPLLHGIVKTAIN